MHLAALCNVRAEVGWGDSRTYFNETLREHYEKTWNPFGAPVTFIFNDEWKPPVREIIAAVNNVPYVKKAPEHPILPRMDALPLADDLRKKLIQAAGTKRYCITVTALQNGKLFHYYKAQDFPPSDMLSSLTHLTNEVKEKEFKPQAAAGPRVIDEARTSK